MFFLRCFSVFIVNFEQANVCLDNCCIANSFKTYLKSLAKMNTFGWCENRCLLRIKIATQRRESEQRISKTEIGFYQGLK